MGGVDKGWLMLDDLPLWQHAWRQLQGQTLPPQRIVLSANRHLERYAASGLAVIADLRLQRLGPMAGIEAALTHTCADWLLVVPCDVPKLPLDLADRLLRSVGEAKAAYALTAERSHPACCVLARALLPALTASLDNGQARLWQWLDQQAAVAVTFPDDAAFDNLNTPQALQAAQTR